MDSPIDNVLGRIFPDSPVGDSLAPQAIRETMKQEIPDWVKNVVRNNPYKKPESDFLSGAALKALSGIPKIRLGQAMMAPLFPETNKAMGQRLNEFGRDYPVENMFLNFFPIPKRPEYKALHLMDEQLRFLDNKIE